MPVAGSNVMSDATPNPPEVTPVRVVARTGPAVGMRGGLKIVIPGVHTAVTQSVEDDDNVFPAEGRPPT
jgi:hypothetical protein